MGSFILITGGVRSGKSAYAQSLAQATGSQVVFVATAQAFDKEFARRIARHRRDRPANWQTIEEPRDLARAVRQAFAMAPVALVDDLTLWASNRLLQAAPDPDHVEWHAQLEQVETTLLIEVQEIADAVPGEGRLIVVSQETGWGIVPPYPLGRAYRDLLGRVNQRVAARADEVYLMVAGLAIEVKRLATATPMGADVRSSGG